MAKEQLDEEFSAFVAGHGRRWAHVARLLTRDADRRRGPRPAGPDPDLRILADASAPPTSHAYVRRVPAQRLPRRAPAPRKASRSGRCRTTRSVLDAEVPASRAGSTTATSSAGCWAPSRRASVPSWSCATTSTPAQAETAEVLGVSTGTVAATTVAGAGQAARRLRASGHRHADDRLDAGDPRMRPPSSDLRDAARRGGRRDLREPDLDAIVRDGSGPSASAHRRAGRAALRRGCGARRRRGRLPVSDLLARTAPVAGAGSPTRPAPAPSTSRRRPSRARADVAGSSARCGTSSVRRTPTPTRTPTSWAPPTPTTARGRTRRATRSGPRALVAVARCRPATDAELYVHGLGLTAGGAGARRAGRDGPAVAACTNVYPECASRAVADGVVAVERGPAGPRGCGRGEAVRVSFVPDRPVPAPCSSNSSLTAGAVPFTERQLVELATSADAARIPDPVQPPGVSPGRP